jgi:hypothetical protein
LEASSYEDTIIVGLNIAKPPTPIPLFVKENKDFSLFINFNPANMHQNTREYRRETHI